MKIEKSVYAWKGKLKEEGEFLLIIKAKKENWEMLEKRIGEMHPYSVPEIVCLGVNGVSGKYLGWIYGEPQKKE